MPRGISQPHFFMRLNRNVKGDLRIWQTFLSSLNGRSLFLDDTCSNNHKLNLYIRMHLMPLVLAPYADVNGAMGNGRTIG